VSPQPAVVPEAAPNSVAAAPAANATVETSIPPKQAPKQLPEAPPRNVGEVAPAAPKPPELAATVKPVPPPVGPKSEDHVAELSAGGVRWRWPGEGKVVGTF